MIFTSIFVALAETVGITKHVDIFSGSHGVKVSESYRTKKRSDRIVMTDEARVLKLIRSEVKLSMRKVADLIGVSDTYIAHLENGRIDLPPEERLNRLLKVYGVRKGSFEERVRNHKQNQSSREQLLELVSRMREREIDTILAVARGLLS